MPFRSNPADCRPLTAPIPEKAGLGRLTDEQLLAAVRNGCIDAYDTVFQRYRTLAVRIAHRIVGNSDSATETAHEVLCNILSAIQNGYGPTENFRGYLKTAVTHEAYKRSRQQSRETLVAEHPESSHPPRDFTTDLLDPELIEAFRSLPKRWQQAIWHLDVEDRQPKDVAPLFGLTANALVALHRRSKEGLRAAYKEISELQARSLVTHPPTGPGRIAETGDH